MLTNELFIQELEQVQTGKASVKTLKVNIKQALLDL